MSSDASPSSTSPSRYFRCHSCSGLNRARDPGTGKHPKCGRCQATIDLTNTPFDVDDDALARLIKTAPVPILVDFWAPWCGPCKAVAPHLAQLARTHSGKLLVAKVNTDRHKRTAGQLKVRAIPTLAVYSGGRLVKIEPGARMGAQLQAFVEPFLR